MKKWEKLFFETRKTWDYETRSATEVEYRGPSRAWVCLTVVSLMIVSIVYGIARVADYVYNRGCESTAVAMHREYKYSFFTGCLVMGDDGRLLPVEAIRESKDKK